MSQDKGKTQMIGFVAWGGHTVAELWGVDQWRVIVNGKDDPQAARNLAALYADTDQGPSEGYYGHDILVDLARRMEGTWWFHQPSPIPSGAIP